MRHAPMGRWFTTEHRRLNVAGPSSWRKDQSISCAKDTFRAAPSSRSSHAERNQLNRISLFDRSMDLVKVDFSPKHRQPSTLRLILATIVSVVGSVLADALLVVAGQAAFPSTKGYVHYQFHDYARLTVIGVVIACLAWPVVTRISSAPRWLFFRLAILVTLVLWLPDIWILHQGAPARAVAVLMVMHLAIAVVTYNALVRIAPVRRTSEPT
jgi:hypothetical protein